MANTYKDIIITANRNSNTADPNISFRGANTGSNTEITLRVYPDSNGTLSFEGSAGQLFSITNDLTGSIFSVNDISGIPSIEAFANGQVRLAQYSGNVLIGNSTTLSTNTVVTTTINATTANISAFARLNVVTANITTVETGNTLTLSTGIGSNSNVVITANGTEYVRVTNTGNVGIGTTNPTSNLHVVGTANVSSNIIVGAGSASAPSYTTAGDNNTGIFFPTADNVSITGAGTEQVRIIGTASATDYVELRGGGAGQGGVYVSTGGSSTNPNLYLSSKGSGSVQFFTNGVGVTRQFLVAHTASAVNYLQVAGAATGAGPTFSVAGNDTNIDLNVATKGTGSFIVSTNNSERMRIANSGNVGIGTTSPTYKLEVNGSIAITNTTGSVVSTQSGNVFTTSAVTSYNVDTFASATFRAAKYFALMEATTGPTYGTIELNLVHDGTTVYLSQYGETKSNASANLGVFDASITSGNLNLTFTPGSVYTAQTVKVVRLAVTD